MKNVMRKIKIFQISSFQKGHNLIITNYHFCWFFEFRTCGKKNSPWSNPLIGVINGNPILFCQSCIIFSRHFLIFLFFAPNLQKKEKKMAACLILHWNLFKEFIFDQNSVCWYLRGLSSCSSRIRLTSPEQLCCSISEEKT